MKQNQDRFVTLKYKNVSKNRQPSHKTANKGKNRHYRQDILLCLIQSG